MPIKHKQEDGTEIEYFTAEELEEQKKKALEDAQAAAKTELEKVQSEVKAKEEELAKLKEKDTNFTKVKTEAEKEIERLNGEINTLKNTVVGNYKTELLKKLSGGDADIQKKIELEYGSFAGDAVTNEQISERMLKAYRIAKPDVVVGTLDEAFAYVGARGQANLGTDPKKDSETSKTMQKYLNISEEDAKKYGAEVDKLTEGNK